MKQATCRNKFSGKAWQRRIDNCINGKTDIKAVWLWVREGRIDTQQFEELINAIINAVNTE